MATLVLANTDTLAMAPRADRLSDHFLRISAAAAKRMAWIAGACDAVITPTPMSGAFLDYIAAMTGHRGRIRSAARSGRHETRPLPISDSDVSAIPSVANLLRQLADDASIDRIEPYIADGVAETFARSLGGIPVTFDPAWGPARPDVTRTLNDKAKFRSFAAGLGVPLAQGETCTTVAELADAVARLLPRTGTVILKMARHSGADGNRAISTTSDEPVLGADQIVFLGTTTPEALGTALRKTGLSAGAGEPIIVEAYYRNRATFGLHYDIEPGAVRLRGHAEIILNPGYGGAYWSAEGLMRLDRQVLEWANRLAQHARELGHVGPLSIDIIESHTVGHLACEVNGRHGGFSTVRSLTRAMGLLDDVSQGDRVVLARNRLELPTSFDGLIAGLSEAGLHYRADQRRGVIVMVEGTQASGPFDIVIVGMDRDDVLAAEAGVLSLFNRCVRTRP